VALVRDHQVDLLAVQEYTPAARTGLAAAGLDTLLTYHEAYPLGGVGGSALYARFPLSDGGFRGTRFSFNAGNLGCWWAGLASEPAATPNGALRILIGDFNATLDHVALRRLLATGYRDAASVVGTGLTPTWPYDGNRCRWSRSTTFCRIRASASARCRRTGSRTPTTEPCSPPSFGHRHDRGFSGVVAGLIRLIGRLRPMPGAAPARLWCPYASTDSDVAHGLSCCFPV
jgi:hypothetical protein